MRLVAGLAKPADAADDDCGGEFMDLHFVGTSWPVILYCLLCTIAEETQLYRVSAVVVVL